MSWHIYDAHTRSCNGNNDLVVELGNRQIGSITIEGSILVAGELTSILVTRTFNGDGQEIYTAPDDVLYLDTLSGKASYDPSPLINSGQSS